MTKDNLLFGIVGTFLGFTIGFMFANFANQSANTMTTTTPVNLGTTTGGTTQNSNLPPGHPDISGSETGFGQTQMSGAMPGVQAAIDKAKQEPNNFEAQLGAGDIFYKIQKYDQAIEFFKKANQLQPENYQVIVNLGNSYFDMESYDEAEKWYTQALAKKSDDTNVRTDLGLTFMFRSVPNYDRAIQEFQKSLSINPNHIQALQNLTVAYTKKGDAANAKSTLAKLESVDATNTAIAKLRDDINKIQK